MQRIIGNASQDKISEISVRKPPNKVKGRMNILRFDESAIVLFENLCYTFLGKEKRQEKNL